MYDIFISYRRDGGHEMARLLYEKLKGLGYNCFFDIEELGAGKFNDKLYENVEGTKNFVLVLSPGALDRCVNEDDWVRHEIETAIKNKKNIIPIMMQGFVWPKELPESMAALSFYNAVHLVREYFDACITKLTTRFTSDTLAKPMPSQSDADLELEKTIVDYLDKNLKKFSANELLIACKWLAGVSAKKVAAILDDLVERGLILCDKDAGGDALYYDPDYTTRSLESDYTSALESISKGEFSKAEKILSSLSGYKDSDELSAYAISRKSLEIFDYKPDGTAYEIIGLKDKNTAKIDIPDCVSKIANDAFADSAKLTSVHIAGSVASIGERAFFKCAALCELTLENGISAIGKGAFRNCTSLSSVTIPNSVSTISSYAFSNCTALTSISIPDGVTMIADMAFAYCESLGELYIGKNVDLVYATAFTGCARLSSVVIDSENKHFDSIALNIKKGAGSKIRIKKGKPSVASASMEKTEKGGWLSRLLSKK